jgi:hypothetical protein
MGWKSGNSVVLALLIFVTLGCILVHNYLGGDQIETLVVSQPAVKASCHIYH